MLEMEEIPKSAHMLKAEITLCKQHENKPLPNLTHCGLQLCFGELLRKHESLNTYQFKTLVQLTRFFFSSSIIIYILMQLPPLYFVH